LVSLLYFFLLFVLFSYITGGMRMTQTEEQATDSAPLLVGFGIDTLILNMRYADANYEPVKKELDKELAEKLDLLQQDARRDEQAVATDWDFNHALLFLEPHGAGKQWRWLLSCRWLSIAVSRGKFNDIIAQVRFSSEYLWSEAWAGDAISKVHDLLMSIFGESIVLQVSEVHLCADVAGFDLTSVDFEQHFVTRVRKNDAIYAPLVDGVALDCHRVSSLRFSSHGSPISCVIYNKVLEIEQKSHKTWFYDLWRAHGWDGESPVSRTEFRFKRDFFRNLTAPINGAYDLLDHLKPLWDYAAGRLCGGSDGLPDGWLRYVVPSDDSNRSRWLVHPVWAVVQSAFAEPVETVPEPIVRKRVREVNVERGVAAIIGYFSTLAAWLGGPFALPGSDVSLLLRWFYEAALEYLASKDREFPLEVLKKQLRYGEVLSMLQHATSDVSF
jgi:hypothetical protein